MPTLPNPGHGAVAVAVTTALTWSSSGATSYDVSFGTTIPPPQVVSGQLNPSYQPPQLSANTVYYWQITARNGVGSTAGPIWSFTTSSQAAQRNFNGNGKADLVWQDNISRQATVWYMGGDQGNILEGSNWLTTSDVPDWAIVGVADFNGDGKPDLVWQNDTTRQVVVWYMGGAQGNQFLGSSWLAPLGAPGWTVVAAADFNRDGKPDLVWQNDDTRQVTVWYMGGNQGDTFQGSSWLTSSGVPGWTVVAAADFNQDGIPDLVWQNDDTRQVTIWYMSGTGGNVVERYDWISESSAPGWRVVGSDDFNGDGCPDLVWQSDTTGQVTVWYLGGTGGVVALGYDWLASSDGLSGWRAIAR
jgi:hypothetical protein